MYPSHDLPDMDQLKKWRLILVKVKDYSGFVNQSVTSTRHHSMDKATESQCHRR
jgi:hypothetical protein